MSVVGCGGGALQLETLAYMVLPTLLNCGGTFIATQLFDDIWSLHRSSSYDVTNAAKTAIQLSNFSSVRRRCRNQLGCPLVL